MSAPSPAGFIVLARTFSRTGPISCSPDRLTPPPITTSSGSNRLTIDVTPQASAAKGQQRDQHAALRIERPAAADADGAKILPFDGRRVDGAPAEREQPLERRPGAFVGATRLDDERLHHAGLVDDARGELCAA